jgi:hypothetical protein
MSCLAVLDVLDVLEVEVKDGMVVTEPRFESRTCKCQIRWTKLDKTSSSPVSTEHDAISSHCLPLTVPTTVLHSHLFMAGQTEFPIATDHPISTPSRNGVLQAATGLLIARRRSPPNIAHGQRQQQYAGVALESFSSDSRLLQCSADADAGSVSCLSDWLVPPWAWLRRLQLVQSLAWPQAPTMSATLLHTTRTAHLRQGRAWLCMRARL